MKIIIKDNVVVGFSTGNVFPSDDVDIVEVSSFDQIAGFEFAEDGNLENELKALLPSRDDAMQDLIGSAEDFDSLKAALLAGLRSSPKVSQSKGGAGRAMVLAAILRQSSQELTEELSEWAKTGVISKDIKIPEAKVPSGNNLYNSLPNLRDGSLLAEVIEAAFSSGLTVDESGLFSLKA